jgi:hypothetical protein
VSDTGSAQWASSFLWPLCCLFFDLRILINPLVQTLLQTLIACLILIIRRFLYRYDNLVTQFLKKLFPFLTPQICLCNSYILSEKSLQHFGYVIYEEVIAPYWLVLHMKKNNCNPCYILNGKFSKLVLADYHMEIHVCMIFLQVERISFIRSY